MKFEIDCDVTPHLSRYANRADDEAEHCRRRRAMGGGGAAVGQPGGRAPPALVPGDLRRPLLRGWLRGAVQAER